MFLFINDIKMLPSTLFLSEIYGNLRQFLPHLFIPLSLLFSLKPCLGGSLALIKKSDIFFFLLLNATKGGSGNTDFK